MKAPTLASLILLSSLAVVAFAESGGVSGVDDIRDDDPQLDVAVSSDDVTTPPSPYLCIDGKVHFVNPTNNDGPVLLPGEICVDGCSAADPLKCVEGRKGHCMYTITRALTAEPLSPDCPQPPPPENTCVEGQVIDGQTGQAITGKVCTNGCFPSGPKCLRKRKATCINNKFLEVSLITDPVTDACPQYECINNKLVTSENGLNYGLYNCEMGCTPRNCAMGTQGYCYLPGQFSYALPTWTVCTKFYDCNDDGHIVYKTTGQTVMTATKSCAPGRCIAPYCVNGRQGYCDHNEISVVNNAAPISPLCSTSN